MEMQLCSDLFLSLGGLDRIQHQIGVLLRTHLVRYDTVVVEVTDNREVKEALSCAYIRYVRYPLLVRTFSNKVPVKQIRIISVYYKSVNLATMKKEPSLVLEDKRGFLSGKG